MKKKLNYLLVVLITLLLVVGASFYLINHNSKSEQIAIKALVISMFEPETTPILDNFDPWHAYEVPGFNSKFPQIKCNSDQICSMTTGMGYANAATSLSALIFSPKFDLSKTYFLISGIAGISPHKGTLGTAAWANYIVDFGIQQELDAREKPADWASGYIGVDSNGSDSAGPNNYQTHLYTLNSKLVQKAYELSKNVQLKDDPKAAAFRKNYTYAPANQYPKVTICDTASSDTWFSGTHLSLRAEKWTDILTGGKGNYCTTQQEDNATLTALTRGNQAGLLDISRVLDLRTGSDFDRPYKGYSDVDNLLKYADQNGFGIATDNLAVTLKPVIEDMVSNWANWSRGEYLR